MRNAKISALQMILFERVFFMNYARKWSSYCPKVTRDNEGDMLTWICLSDSFVVIPSLRYLWNIYCANFHSWDKTAMAKANTIIKKSKLVFLHGKFIHWATYVLWIDFFLELFVQLAWEHLVLNARKFGRMTKNHPNVQTLQIWAKLLGAPWCTSTLWWYTTI